MSFEKRTDETDMKPTCMLATLVLALTIVVALRAEAEAGRTSAPAEAVLAEVPKATWVADGRGPRVVYIFFDPNCPSCQLLYRNLRT